MRHTILLNRSEDTKKVEGQEQSRFIKTILETLEVPIEFDPDESLSIEKKQKFKQDLREFSLSIVNDVDGGVKIYIGDDLIGEWYKSTYKLKQDLSQKVRRDRLYLEMTCEYWSLLFESGEEKAGEPT